MTLPDIGPSCLEDFLKSLMALKRTFDGKEAYQHRFRLARLSPTLGYENIRHLVQIGTTADRL